MPDLFDQVLLLMQQNKKKRTRVDTAEENRLGQPKKIWAIQKTLGTATLKMGHSFEIGTLI